MSVCVTCGRPNADDARFCSSCGSVLAAPPSDVRKTVTILRCDVTGSTALGERLDPESLRRVMGRYFDEMARVIERHGGTVEKFIGDAVMAVFGIPVLHEDDALRAVLAAVEMREALAALNDELVRDLGVLVEVRTGITTGEVLAGDPSGGQAFVTGDAANTAARLESSAAPGEILVGNPTYVLVSDAVEVERIGPLRAKGKAEPLAAWRLLAVRPHAETFVRRLDAPMVGRTGELAVLRDEFKQVAVDRSCRLVTILGEAGIGKSRLATELVETVGAQASAFSGRCLPYGEGITYWPLVEIVRQIAEGKAESRLLDLLSGEPEGRLAAERVAAVVGGGDHVAGSDEIAWAIRKLLEHLARERPVLIVLDDLQWGEATFLDLVEHVVYLSRSAPILLVALARPELLELRPAWPGLRVALEALSGPESTMLIQSLLGERILDDHSRGRIAAAGEGNPLFLEQMLAMLAEDPSAGELAIPPTIQALLGTRLDRLDAGPRTVIQRASVVGQEFWTGALRALASEPEQLGSSLLELVRAALIRPKDSTIGGEDAFSFAHILVRDAAYRALPKQERAALHERLATWFEGLDASRSLQHDEIVGYHLEQAFRYRTELGPANAETELLARSAGERLAAAGRRAYLRGDTPAAVNLLGRAGDLFPARDPRRLELLPDLGAALMEAGDLERASILLDEAVKYAKPGAASLASTMRQMIATQQDYDMPPEALPELDAAISAFESEGDQRGLARAWLLRGEIHNFLGELEQMGVAAMRSAEHARRAGDHRAEAEALRLFGGALVYGPTPVSAGIIQLEEILAVGSSNRMVEAAVSAPLSALKGMAGDFDRARELVECARRIYDELGLTFQLARLGFMSGRVERLAGNLDGAAREFRQGCELLQAMGERGRLAGMAIELANVLADLDELGEAEAWLSIAEDAMGPESAAQSFDVRASRAKFAAARGDPGGELLGEEVRAQAAASDDYTWRGDALFNFAVSALASGRALEAERFLRDALAVYQAKGDVVSAARVQALLDR